MQLHGRSGVWNFPVFFIFLSTPACIGAWCRWKPWKSTSSAPVRSLLNVSCFFFGATAAVCTRILDMYILIWQCHCSEIWALNSAIKMAEFKKGRLKQVDENPQLLDDYIRAWSLFPALKQVGVVDCFYFALQFCFIEPFWSKRLGSPLLPPTQRSSLTTSLMLPSKIWKTTSRPL